MRFTVLLALFALTAFPDHAYPCSMVFTPVVPPKPDAVRIAGVITGYGVATRPVPKVDSAVVRLTPVGAAPTATVAGDSALPGVVNYGGRGVKPVTAPTYGRVRYRDVYRRWTAWLSTYLDESSSLAKQEAGGIQ